MAPEAGTTVGVRQDAVAARLVARPGRVALDVREHPAGVAMEIVAVPPGRGVGMQKAFAGTRVLAPDPDMPVKVVPVHVAGPRTVTVPAVAHARVTPAAPVQAATGTHPIGRHPLVIAASGMRGVLKRLGRTATAVRAIGPARAVPAGVTREIAGAARTVMHPGRARIDLPGIPVMTLVAHHRPPRAVEIDPQVRVLRVVGIRAGRRVRIVPGQPGLARLAVATRGGTRVQTVGRVRPEPVLRVAAIATVRRAPTVVRAPGGRAERRGRRAHRGSYVQLRNRGRQSLVRTATNVSRCLRASVPVTTSRSCPRSTRTTYRAMYGPS